MADTNTTLGSRNNFIPGTNTIGWGNLVNRFLRGFAGLNVTKFSILPWVPHGTYLGGWLKSTDPQSTNAVTDITFYKSHIKSGMSGGFRRLPVMSNANDSIFQSAPSTVSHDPILGPNSKEFSQYQFSGVAKNTVLVSTSSEEGSEFKYNKVAKERVDRIFALDKIVGDSGIDLVSTIFERGKDYVVFDMAKTMVVPLNPQYILHSRYAASSTGVSPFYEVCDIADVSRDPTLYWERGLAVSKPFPLTPTGAFLSTVEMGALFCLQYVNPTPIPTISGVPIFSIVMNPGVAHVMYIEFDSTDRFSDSSDELTSLNQILEA
jgi:hypothetical protein